MWQFAENCGWAKSPEARKKLPCFVSQSPLEGWWREAQTGLDSPSWWMCCRLVSPLLSSTTKGKQKSKQYLIIHFKRKFRFPPLIKFVLKQLWQSGCLSTRGHTLHCSSHHRAVGFPLQCREEERERGGWEGLRRRENRKGEPSSSHWCKTPSLILFLPVKASSLQLCFIFSLRYREVKTNAPQCTSISSWIREKDVDFGYRSTLGWSNITNLFSNHQMVS